MDRELRHAPGPSDSARVAVATDVGVFVPGLYVNELPHHTDFLGLDPICMRHGNGSERGNFRRRSLQVRSR